MLQSRRTNTNRFIPAMIISSTPTAPHKVNRLQQLRSSLKQAFRLMVVSLTCLGITSCSLFCSGSKTVLVSSNDPNAILRADGQYIGKGSGSASLKKNKTHIITAQNGTKQGAAMLDSEISITGVLDLIGGICFLVPFLGFLSKGAWTLDKDSVYVEVH